MFLSGSSEDDVRSVIEQTIEDPDSTLTQPDGTRIRIRTFTDPVGEIPFFDAGGKLTRRLLYKVRVVFNYRERRKNIISAYPPLTKKLKRKITFMLRG